MQSNFKVYPVQMVVSVSGLRREDRNSGQQRSRNPKNAFCNILMEKAAETDCSGECYVVTYDKNSRLQTYYYLQPKEYTF